MCRHVVSARAVDGCDLHTVEAVSVRGWRKEPDWRGTPTKCESAGRSNPSGGLTAMGSASGEGKTLAS